MKKNETRFKEFYVRSKDDEQEIKKRNRDADLHFRVTEEEKEAIRKKAEDAGSGMSDYLRRCALERDLFHKYDRDAVYQLKRIGRNLNQALRHMHREEFDDDLMESFRRILRNLEETIR